MSTLSSAKIGDQVKIAYYSREVQGTVVGHRGGSTLIAWKDNDKKRMPGSWSIDSERSFGDSILAKVSNQYKHGYWFFSYYDCSIIGKRPQSLATIGFLAACIAAGAGLSRVTSNAATKNAKLEEAYAS